MTAGVLWLLRVVAAVGGAAVGWFLSDPLARLLYRGLARRPLPGWAAPWARLAGALLAGLLVYLLIPLGGGPGGLGWGPGDGGSPGQGAGNGGGPGPSPVAPDGTKPSDVKPPVPATPRKQTREVVEIELVGGPRYPGESRYYLVRRTGPPKTIEEVESFLRTHKGDIEVHLVLTDESVDLRHPAVARLREKASEYRTPIVEPREKK